MIMKEKIVVGLENEEKEALLKVQKLVNEIYDKSGHCELAFEDDIDDILDDIQETIRCII